MSCPTCGHTMACITSGVYHCERCGTLINCHVISGQSVIPKLVERCRNFFQTATPRGWEPDWDMMSIAESINLSEDRP